jgi:prepilin-type N-terminal cleavage/methylation domain-containing protein
VKPLYSRLSPKDGFTLIEILISMFVFIIVMVIASKAFNSLLTNSSKYSKMEETNIEGVVGLEVMRHDLEQMGFGLPWGWSKIDATTLDLVDGTITYAESGNSVGANLNDAQSGSTTGGIPRAVVGLGKNSSAITSTSISDYLALKSTTVGIDKVAQRWTYVPYHNMSTSTGRVSQPQNTSPQNAPKGAEKVIAINSNFNDSNKDHKLLIDSSNDAAFYVDFSNFSITPYPNTTVVKYLPVTDQDTVMLYGVNGTSNPRMPFNRADYFVSTSAGTVPPFCAPGTGVLYKATVNHADGGYTYIPILDCVADMRVVLGWDTDGSGGIKTYSSLPTAVGGNPVDVGGSGSANDIGTYLTSAKEVRERLKLIKVYILSQEGKVDPQYQFPASIVVGADPSSGDSSNNGLATSNNTYTFTTAQRQYRWKIYRIVARPKNLYSNQR